MIFDMLEFRALSTLIALAITESVPIGKIHSVAFAFFF